MIIPDPQPWLEHCTSDRLEHSVLQTDRSTVYFGQIEHIVLRTGRNTVYFGQVETQCTPDR